MALKIKKHTLTFIPLTEDADADGSVPIPTEGAGVEVRGQRTPLSAEAAFNITGENLKRPQLWMCDDTDAVSIKVGYPVTEGSRRYEVMSPNEIWNATIPAQAYMTCVLEEREFA